MSALGLIETLGLLPAIEAADAMLKAADVRLLEKNLAGGGLVTITVTGETAAVKAAVDAGSAAVRRIRGASLVSAHVIARPDSELATVLTLNPLPGNDASGIEPIVPTTEPPAMQKSNAPVGQSGRKK